MLIGIGIHLFSIYIFQAKNQKNQYSNIQIETMIDLKFCNLLRLQNYKSWVKIMININN